MIPDVFSFLVWQTIPFQSLSQGVKSLLPFHRQKVSEAHSLDRRSIQTAVTVLSAHISLACPTHSPSLTVMWIFHVFGMVRSEPCGLFLICSSFDFRFQGIWQMGTRCISSHGDSFAPLYLNLEPPLSWMVSEKDIDMFLSSLYFQTFPVRPTPSLSTLIFINFLILFISFYSLEWPLFWILFIRFPPFHGSEDHVHIYE